MKTLAKGLMGCAVACLLAGCPTAKTQSEAKVEAYQRWYATRAGILLNVGEEQFIVGDLDAAGASASEALALQPDLVPAQALLARVNIEKGNYVKAARQLESAIELAPQNGQLQYLLGVTYEKRREYESALNLYQKARALAPENPAYILASAEMLVQLGQPAEGLALLESKLSSIDPTVGIYKAAGELALLAGQPRRAVEHYSQASMLAPGDVEVLEGLAKANFFAGRHKEAVSVMHELRTKDNYDQQAWVHTLLGNAYMACERPRDAKASFERAIELEPSVAEHWVNLAKAALACNDTHRTVLAANQALALKSDLVDATVLLGYGLLADGRVNQARDVLAAAARKHPTQAMLQCLLGRSYSALGDQAQARRCYEVALSIEPNNPIAQQLLASARP